MHTFLHNARKCAFSCSPNNVCWLTSRHFGAAMQTVYIHRQYDDMEYVCRYLPNASALSTFVYTYVVAPIYIYAPCRARMTFDCVLFIWSNLRRRKSGFAPQIGRRDENQQESHRYSAVKIFTLYSYKKSIEAALCVCGALVEARWTSGKAANHSKHFGYLFIISKSFHRALRVEWRWRRSGMENPAVFAQSDDWN